MRITYLYLPKYISILSGAVVPFRVILKSDDKSLSEAERT